MIETLAGIAGVLAMKLTAIVVGYKIVKLGYEALVRGIKGEFDFGGKITDQAEIKLLSASPGLFFVLLGCFVICWALFVQKPINFESKESINADSAVSSTEPEPMEAKK